MARKKTAGTTAIAATSTRSTADATIYTHNLWLNYLKPVSIGLVFSPNALRSAQVELPSQSSEAQKAIEALTILRPMPDDPEGESLVRTLRDPLEFLREFLGWKPDWLDVYRPAPGARMFAGQHLLAPRHDLPEPPAELCKELPNHHDTLAPTFAYRWSPTVTGQMENAPKVCILGLEVPDFDQHNHPIDLDRKPPEADEESFQESPQKKFERLLYETQVPVGLILQGRQVRLVYKPESQQSGYITFPLDALLRPAGRLACTALRDLLRHQRLQTLPSRQRLHHILSESRKFQNEVSTRLAEQVLAALFELLKGFEAADEDSRKQLLKGLRDVPSRTHEIYEGLLTVLMRLVFLLYAEEREMFPGDGLFRQNYSLAGLFDRLVQDEAQHPDTMDQRYGAWPHLIALFRLVYQGVTYRLTPNGNPVKIPERKGDLFDPDRFPFLEGRTNQPREKRGLAPGHESADDLSILEGGRVPVPVSRGTEATTADAHRELPRVPDGVILRVLRNLLYLNEERLSYRSLEVEQIGSVYETIMGFRVETARGRSVAIRPEKKSGAPVTISLEELLDEPGPKRAKWLKDQTGQEISGKSATALKDAATEAELVQALGRLVDARLTPSPVPKGSLVFQPSPERRRTGSHYTPSSLTEPIVRKALEPVLARLGDAPTPDQILALKVCDPAMGSGAFLVQALRQLAARLVRAWDDHKAFPRIPADETPLLFASRLIAQRCLYGVDKNPMAVNLAKLSLWLETLARDHAFTFLDHNLRHGDSLVGLSLAQIDACHWNVADGGGFISAKIRDRLKTILDLRERIARADEFTPYQLLSDLRQQADGALDLLRLIGDAIIGTFFQGGHSKVVETNRKNLANTIRDYLDDKIDSATRLALGLEIERPARLLNRIDPPVCTFHWHIEFPEVFLQRQESDDLVGNCKVGFDLVVGNPPFVGGRKVRDTQGSEYFEWLVGTVREASGNADLVAFFFRRAFDLLRDQATFGLIATNTIGQGDSRSTGLKWICERGGVIYNAVRRLKWPGLAAVTVSVVHVAKSMIIHARELDGKKLPTITAYLFHSGGNGDPIRLNANARMSFQGSIVLGMGFTFDDHDKKGAASPLAKMHQLIADNESNADRIFPYIGGEEVNESPSLANERYVINFENMAIDEARKWPDLLEIIENRVKPERTRRKPNGEFVLRRPLPEKWWIYADKRPALYKAIQGLKRVLVISRVSQFTAFAFLETRMVFSERLVVFRYEKYNAFTLLQSRVHEIYALFFGSSLEDRPMYAPGDCFETFPFPEGFETDPSLEEAGRVYYEYRAALMVRNDEGLTKTYNRFHDPAEGSAEIAELRRLHGEMDRAVLAAYGWGDVDTTCGFDLDWCDAEPADDASTDTIERCETGNYFFESAADARNFAQELVPESSGGKPKALKLPWRYRWRPEVRDEVLARLLQLNRDRADQEKHAGALFPLDEPEDDAGEESEEED